ncbi:L-lactate dehydrogenase B chain [Drosophila pseudoobscura]|uniref:L-lactate dehydrogenase B chain n=1 Tax=Drosophila pseudoobscura pseudoobscura TaxID=46245 RepID=A0A6I8V4R4_DROPS|nr:L-lactate dehydrogenase B chain [Drosophila pseudoobscura]
MMSILWMRRLLTSLDGFGNQLIRPASSFNKVMKPLDCFKPKPSLKITVVGSGQVGAAVAAFLLARNLTKHLVILDVKYDLATAEALDFSHGSAFLGNPIVEACGDGNRTKNSDVIIITAGARPSGKTRSRLDVMHKTVVILKSVVPKLVELSPKAIFIIICNPADVMTFAVQRIGNLEKHRCFTTGCHLDTARFRYLIAKRLKVPTSAVNAYIIGEHGSSAVPVWSSVTVGGIRLSDVVKDLGTDKDQEKWSDLMDGILNAGVHVSKAKGYTNWAVGLTASDVVKCMVENTGQVCCVGTDVKGLYGLKDSVVLSVPCRVTASGISHILELPLNEDERKKLLKSADTLLEAQCSLKW